LDADHDAVYLFNYDGSRLLDHVTWDTLNTDISFARTPLTYYPWIRTIPTPGAVNSDNVQPTITGIRRNPLSPTCSSTVYISARIADSDGTIAGAVLVYSTDSSFHNLILYDDGLHGDSAAADGRFGAQIPAQATRTTVSYYLEAADNEGALVRYPITAPDDVLNYIVDRPPPRTLVNEFMAQNNSTIQDEQGTWEDWIELFNWGNDTVNLAGFALTDNFSNLHKWTFPDTSILPGGFLLVWCDEDGGDPGLHASFKLSAGGERIALSDIVDYGGAVLDSLSFGAQTADVSRARVCDGSGEWALDATPTPDSTNSVCTPVALTVVHNDGSILLNWRSIPGAQSYHVFRLINVGDPVSAGTLVAAVSDTTVELPDEISAQESAFYVIVGVRP
jgi:hypothetical protein